MATSSISGLVSGLPTADLIDQLMQLESVSQSRLKTRLSKEQLAVNSLQTFNSQVASLAAKAKELADAAAWMPLTATSSQAGVSVSAGAGAPVGSFSVHVEALATQHRLRFDDGAALTDVVVTGGTTVELTIGGNTTTIETGDGTLQGLVDALNATGTGVRASTIRQDDGQHRLVVQSAGTGEEQRFTLAAADGSALLGGAEVTEAQDARARVDGVSVTSATNTFTDVVPDLTFTVSAAAVGSTAELVLAQDSSAPAKAVKALIEQVNGLIGQVASLTGYDSATKATGLLGNDSTVRAVGSALQQTIWPPDGGSLASVGIQTDRYGKLTFDEAAFAKALADDPDAVTAAITGAAGLAGRVQAVAEQASDSTDGTLTAALQGRTSSIDRLKSGIEDWDRRLELRRTNLERQFTALETALARMQSQSDWLTSQLGSLAANNG